MQSCRAITVKGPQIAVEPRRRGGNTEGSRAALASPEVSEWTSRPLQRLRLLAQDELLDLAGGGLGQRAEDHFLRRLEAGEALAARSEEHTSELQSLMRISYAVFCLKKKNQTHKQSTS